MEQRPAATPIRESDLGVGIDQFHPETKIGPGGLVDLVNGVARSNTSITKRPGYRLAGGYVPVRAITYYQEATTAGGQITLTFDSSVSLSNLVSTPILVVGRTTLSGAVLGPTGGAVYATGFTVSGQTITFSCASAGTRHFPSGGAAASWATSGMEIDVYGLTLSSTASPLGGPAPDLTTTDTTWVPGVLRDFISPARSGLFLSQGGVPYITGATSAYAAVFPAATTQKTLTSNNVSTTYIGPALYAAAPTHAPARGTITSVGVSGAGYATCISATYSGGDTTYRLYVPGYVASTALSSIIRPGVDSLTVTGASSAVLNGTFPISAISAPDADHLDVTCSNVGNAAADQQLTDTGLSASAGVLTDTFPVGSVMPAANGARLAFSDATLDGADLYLQPSSANCCVGPLAGVLSVGTGVVVGVSGATQVVALASTTAILRGDELLGPDDILHVVRSVNLLGDESISVAVSSGVATATLGAGTTAQLRVGDRVLVAGSASADGVVSVTAVPSPTTFKFATTATSGYSATLVGGTVELGPDVTFGTGTAATTGTLQVNRRWLAIPSAYDSTLTTQPVAPISARPLLTPADRGVTDSGWSAHPSTAMVAKSLYLTDGLNPVKKYDGTTMYDAGIPNQPPLLFLNKKESVSGILNPNAQYNVLGALTAYSFIPADSTGKAVSGAFAVGDVIYLSARVFGLVQAGDVDGVNHRLKIRRPDNTSAFITPDPGAHIQFWPSDAGGSNIPGGVTIGQTYYLGTTAVSSAYYIYASLSDALSNNTGNAVAITAPPGNVLVTGRRLNPIGPNSATAPTQQVLYTTVTSVNSTSGAVTVADPIDTMFYQSAFGTTSFAYANTQWGVVSKAITLKYYAKTRFLDANGNVTGSAGCGAQDNGIRIGVPTEICGTIINFPPLPNRQLARMEWEVYRTGGSSGTPPYYLVASGAYNFSSPGGYPPYISFSDTVQISQLTDATGTAVGQTDFNSTLRSGADAGPDFDRPPLARHAAALDSRLILGNVKSPHRMMISFRRRPDTPILATSSFSPYFIFRVGTSAPADKVLSKSQLVFRCYPVPASVSFSDGPLTGGTIPAGTFQKMTYQFGLDFATELIGSSTYGWNYYWTTIVPTVGSTNVSATVSDTHTLTLSSSDLSKLASGQIVYVTIGTQDISPYPSNYRYYLGKASATTAHLYLTLADALAANSNYITFGASGGNLTINAGDILAAPILNQALTSESVVPVVLDGLLTGGTGFNDVAYDTLSGHLASSTISIEQQLANRLANAINAAQATYNQGNAPSFTPFVYARAGNDVGYATVVVESYDPSAPFNFTYIPNSQDGLFEVFVNGVAYVPDTAFTGIAGTVTSQQQLFPSRLCASYRNYPEIFDNPYAQSAADSDSAIDVDPDDGQEIVSIRPLTSASVTGAAQQSQYVLVWKNQSCYLVDIVQKVVTKLITAGHGADFRRGTLEAWNGVMFTDHSGIHIINANNSYMYKGKMIERLFQQNVNLAAPADATLGYHSRYRNLCMLAVPFTSAADGAGNAVTQPTDVLVYDHTREADYYSALQPPSVGSWSRFSAVPMAAASGFLFDEYYAAWDTCQVYMERRDNLPTDCRDRFDDAISLAVTFRPLDCGAMSLRKDGSALVISFRSTVATSGTTVSVAVDLSDQFVDCDAFTIPAPNPPETLGLSDTSASAVKSYRFSLPTRKFTWLTIRITNSSVDEPVEISELALNVVPLTEAGIQQAAKSSG